MIPSKMDSRRIFLIIDVLLVVAIIISLILLVTTVSFNQNKNAVTECSIIKYDMNDRSMFQIWFSNSTPSINFAQCSIKLDSPSKATYTVNLTDGFTDYPGSSAVSISKLHLSTYGPIKLGEFVTVTGTGNQLEKGSWTVSLLSKDTRGIIAEKAVFVPDTTTTPGIFKSMQASKISDTTWRIAFPSTTQTTALPYLDLKIIGPNKIMTSYKTDGPFPLIYAYNSRTSITINDVTGTSLVNPSDYIDISCPDGVPIGTWTIQLDYKFTNEQIDLITFSA